MNKLLLLITAILLVGCGDCSTPENQDAQASRAVLSQAKSGDFDAKFSDARKVYYDLMDSGEPGYEILSESWVQDGIPEEVWLQWNYDYQTRHGDSIESAKNLDAYYAYVDGKLIRNDNYYKSALQRLTDDSINDQTSAQELLGWLEPNEADDVEELPGHRKLAYEVLLRIYPDIPKYDYSAWFSDRSAQYSKLSSYLSSRIKGHFD